MYSSLSYWKRQETTILIVTACIPIEWLRMNLSSSGLELVARMGMAADRSLSDFQTATGQELNGISGDGPAKWFDHRLKVGSPEIDHGCVITGFNDRGPWKYLGPSPDIGAVEWKPSTHHFSFSQFLRPFQ